LVAEIRKAISEMQNSGIPDIILEMTLMKLSAPPIISVPQIANLDEPKKISYDINEILKELPKSTALMLEQSAVVKNFSDNILTVAVTKSYSGIFQTTKKEIEKFLSEKFNKKITVETIVDENLKISQFDKVKDSDKPFLEESMKIFQVENFKIIDSEE
jgi:sugar-specific transcriptional regulator TrmB